MITLQLLLSTIYCVYNTIADSKCLWTVSVPGGGIETFFLTCAAGKQLITRDSNEEPHNYAFSICANGETCNGEPVMVKQTPSNDSEPCYNLGTWDGNIAPRYQPDNGGQWIFKYPNGAPDCGDPARTWAPTFQCDAAEFAIDTVQTIPGTCLYEVIIHTKYACTGNTQCANITTTTTRIPGDDCLWNDGNYMLNLTTFKDETLAIIDKRNNSLLVAFAPCGNFITCNEEKVSSYRFDYIEEKCIDYLSIWEDGINEPNYDSLTKTWQFIYENGEKCGGLKNIFQVYWHCDYEIKNKADVVSFEQIEMCTFAMHINSSYACV